MKIISNISKFIKRKSKTQKAIIWIIIFSGTIFIPFKKKKASVSYNAQFVSKHSIKIDDDIELKTDDSKSFSSIKLTTGKHKVRIDSALEEEFYVSKKGGVLNIANEEFVVYTIRYKIGKSEDNVLLSVDCIPNALLIDSFVVYVKSPHDYFSSQLTKRKALMANNGTETSELMRTGKNKLFIEKNWDINIEELNPSPEQVAALEEITDGTIFIKKIVTMKQFLLLAKEGKDNLVIKPFSQLDSISKSE